jgi:hypothetical protein
LQLQYFIHHLGKPDVARRRASFSSMAFDIDAPPSPTLTFNPDMILPDKESSPLQKRAIMASWNTGSPPGLHSIATAKYQSVHRVGPGQLSPPIHVRPASPLESIDEADVTPKKSRSMHSLHYATTGLASSPTLRNSPYLSDLAPPRASSRISNSSSSIHSEDLDDIRWPRLDGQDTEESVMLDEDEDRFGNFPKSDDDVDAEAWLATRENETSEDFLSRRADIILANAKKRLNVSGFFPPFPLSPPV